ncbi:MAG: magnesium transporter [Acidobacteria bacterium]|nr:magnesium transporter [Acidobacteriota bacterium]
MSRRLRPFGRLGAILGPDASAARQALVSLVLNSSTSFVAGTVLGSIAGTFERMPGLLVLVPAAIGLRGNIFSSVGTRLSTAIHTGTFRFSSRRDTVLGQNVAASISLTLGLSLVLALVAKGIAVALGIEHSIPIGDLAVISITGGLLASVPVLGATLGMAGGAVRFGWDLDNVSAPIVSTLGDVLTLPALWLATGLVGLHLVTPALAVAATVAALLALVLSLRSPLDELRRISRESLPVLATACAVSAMAGITVEKRFGSFARYPALLVLLPAFLSSAGALGGILSSRLGSKLHLGLVPPTALPSREARRDIGLVAGLAVPVFAFNAVGAHYVALLFNQASPGIGRMLAVTALGGVFAIAFVLFVAYYGTVAAFRLGVDPDTYGIPLVTSSVDFAGAFALVLSIVALGVGAR